MKIVISKESIYIVKIYISESIVLTINDLLFLYVSLHMVYLTFDNLKSQVNITVNVHKYAWSVSGWELE